MDFDIDFNRFFLVLASLFSSSSLKLNEKWISALMKKNDVCCTVRMDKLIILLRVPCNKTRFDWKVPLLRIILSNL